MHVQPWPLANRSTARCWVRERACLRLMLFSIPGPRTSYATLGAALCGWLGHEGDWTEGERTSRVRRSKKFGCSSLEVGCLALLLLVEAVDATVWTAEASVSVRHLLHAGDLAEQLAPRALDRGRGGLDVVHPEAENEAIVDAVVSRGGLGRV